MRYSHRPRAWDILIAGAAFAIYIWTSPLRDLYGLEARTALLARQMLEGGASFFPMIFGKVYPDYNPLYFWLEALFSLPSGHISTFTAVLPSALCAAGLVILTLRLGYEISARTGFLSAMVLAVTPGFWIEASHATIDMTLALCVGVSILCLFLMDRGRRTSHIIFYVLAVSCAFLTKGPLGLVLPCVVWGGYLLSYRRIKDLLSFSFFMGIFGAALIGLEAGLAWHKGGGTLVREIIESQVTGRVGEEANNSIFYYPLFLAKGFGIWWIWMAAWAVAALRSKTFAIKSLAGAVSANKIIRLLLIWLGSVLIIFSLASSRHGRYLLPLFPAIAVLLGLSVEKIAAMSIPGRRWPYERIIDVTLGVLLIVGLASALRPPFSLVTPISLVVIWATVIIAGRVTISKLAAKELRLAVLASWLLVCGLSGYGLIFEPAISRAESGKELAAKAEHGLDKTTPIIIYGIRQDGDGVKYALYSQRPSSELKFIPRLVGDYEGLKYILPARFMLVGYEKDILSLEKATKGIFYFDAVSKGTIHRRECLAAMVTNK